MSGRSRLRIWLAANRRYWLIPAAIVIVIWLLFLMIAIRSNQQAFEYVLF